VILGIVVFSGCEVVENLAVVLLQGSAGKALPFSTLGTFNIPADFALGEVPGEL